MTKLKTFLEKYQPNTKDEAKFIDKHNVDKKEDRNGNSDDIFTASNVKKYDRKKNRKGYEPGEDERMYESVEELIEKKLQPGQKISRQELTKLIMKANPHLDPVHAHALAVATVSRVDEEVQLDERSDKTELEEAASPIAGTRLVSKHGGKDGYHVEVRHNKDWDEYQVHHYHNGKHLGEGPVSYHDNKADAKETAEWCTKNNYVKNGKVMTEEAEQLDELSKGVVKKYIGHATADLETNKRVLASTAKKTGRSLDDVYDDLKSSNLTHRQYKRYRGIDTAVGKIQPNDKWTRVAATTPKKLTKEDIINRTIEKFLPEAPASAEEIFEGRIENLPEAHRKLLTGLFESLSDVNKLTMLDKMGTEEGINDLLDFAIHARGA